MEMKRIPNGSDTVRPVSAWRVVVKMKCTHRSFVETGLNSNRITQRLSAKSSPLMACFDSR